MGHTDGRVEDAEVIVDLGRGGDGRAGIRRGDALLDSDRGRESLNVIHLRLLHLVEELTRIGGEALDIATLAFGEEGVEGE